MKDETETYEGLVALEKSRDRVSDALDDLKSAIAEDPSGIRIGTPPSRVEACEDELTAAINEGIRVACRAGAGDIVARSGSWVQQLNSLSERNLSERLKILLLVGNQLSGAIRQVLKG